jgi:DNA-binding transcriptional LysR family regulator
MTSNQNLDLHALECFDLLMRERSVSRTAERLGISQSSASEMLARLRDRFGDPLLVRSRDGMRPTPRAQALLPQVRLALDQLRGLLEKETTFRPEAASTRFRLTTTDYTQLLLMPTLTGRLQREAPGCGVDVLPINVLHIETALEAGDVDLAIAYCPDPPKGLRRRPLFTDRYRCIARRGHPAAAGATTPAAFAALSHINVAPSGLTYFGSIVDSALKKAGLSRRVAMSSPHFLLAAHVVAQSDLVLALPGLAAQALARSFPLEIIDIPLVMRDIEISMYWHDRCHASQAHQWFRACVRDALAPVHGARRAPRRVA